MSKGDGEVCVFVEAIGNNKMSELEIGLTVRRVGLPSRPMTAFPSSFD